MIDEGDDGMMSNANVSKDVQFTRDGEVIRQEAK